MHCGAVWYCRHVSRRLDLVWSTVKSKGWIGLVLLLAGMIMVKLACEDAARAVGQRLNIIFATVDQLVAKTGNRNGPVIGAPAIFAAGAELCTPINCQPSSVCNIEANRCHPARYRTDVTSPTFGPASHFTVLMTVQRIEMIFR